MFSKSLVNWFRENKRELPWRCDKNPYHVWISEVMLQQTRIEAVISYYNRFMEELPTIASLAEVDDDKLLKLWEGLGYYSRARNLKKAAIIILEKYNGIFPNTYEDILSLPGIGPYTAAAISSICFHLKKPTVDGNVLRVVSRIREDASCVDLDKTRKEVTSYLEGIMDEDSGDFNEGLMELGEVICIPNGTPLCEKCPIFLFCNSYKHHTQMDYPVKKEKINKNEIYYIADILICKDKVAIVKRKDGLLKGMYGFPLKEGKGKNTYSHIFTHVIWHISPNVKKVREELDGYIWVRKEELKSRYAIPTAFSKIILLLEDILK